MAASYAVYRYPVLIGQFIPPCISRLMASALLKVCQQALFILPFSLHFSSSFISAILRFSSYSNECTKAVLQLASVGTQTPSETLTMEQTMLRFTATSGGASGIHKYLLRHFTDVEPEEDTTHIFALTHARFKPKKRPIIQIKRISLKRLLEVTHGNYHR